jgi:uncharacterized protein YchJ
MPYAPFHDLFPEVAKRETRNVTVLDKNAWGLPCADYGLAELYCDDPKCDCRRVMLCVFSSLTQKPAAYIAFGWESSEYYATWMNDDDPEILAALKGPELNVGSPQSKHAPAILKLLAETVFNDHYYVQRLQTHYWMFRQKITENKENAHVKIGRNDPCPCGSGKKYKKCCAQ